MDPRKEVRFGPRTAADSKAAALELNRCLEPVAIAAVDRCARPELVAVVPRQEDSCSATENPGIEVPGLAIVRRIVALNGRPGVECGEGTKTIAARCLVED